MTASPFTITPTPPTSLELEVGKDGTFSFTVTNLAAPDVSQELVFEAMWIGPDGKSKIVDWLVVGPSRRLTLAGGQTATVTIAAKPRTTSPLGENRIQLAVADNERPHDVFAYSSPVSCVVHARPVPPPRKRFPRWLIPVIAGCAVLAVLNIVLVVLLAGDDDEDAGLGTPCDTQSECGKDLVCADSHKCLRPGGAACTDGAACTSNECVRSLQVCTIPLGAACVVNGKVPCFTLGSCRAATKTCVGALRAPCTVNAQCASGLCSRGACAPAFTVRLVESGVNKIAVIKVVREFTGLGLAESKTLVDSAPKDVKTRASEGEATELLRRLQGAGALAAVVDFVEEF